MASMDLAPAHRPWRLLLAHFALGLSCDFASTIYSYFLVTPIDLPDLGTLSITLWLVLTVVIFRRLYRSLGDGSVPRIVDLLTVAFIFGSAVYIVANSIQPKLWVLGYEDQLAHVTSYPGVDSKLLPIFRLIYFYDEVLGHVLMFVPYFLMFIVAYVCALGRPTAIPTAADPPAAPARIPRWAYWVIGLESLYLAWDIVEGQSVLLYFVVILPIFVVVKLRYRARGYVATAFSRTIEVILVMNLVWIFVWFATVGRFHSLPQVLETLKRAVLG